MPKLLDHNQQPCNPPVDDLVVKPSWSCDEAYVIRRFLLVLMRVCTHLLLYSHRQPGPDITVIPVKSPAKQKRLLKVGTVAIDVLIRVCQVIFLCFVRVRVW